MDTDRQHVGRRGVLRAAAGATAAAGLAGPATAQPTFDGWLGGVDNYDGIADRTGQDEVTVQVGTQANGGAFGFGPPAVRVDPGTTVVWEWTGEGGQHNVVAQDGATFESDLVGDAGFTFEHTFESEGLTTYYCAPHQSLGMKGVVVVGGAGPGEEGGEGSGSEAGGGGEQELHELGVPIQAHYVGSATILGIVATIVYTFYVLKYGETPHAGHGGEE